MSILKNHIRHVLAAVVMITSFTMTGCNDKGDDNPLGTLSIKLDYAQVQASSGSQFMAVEASGQWSISFEYEGEYQNWCVVAPESGVGSKNDVVLTYAANGEETDRTVTVVLAEGDRTARVTLTQKGYSSGGGGTDPDPEPDPIKASWLELPRIDDKANCMATTHFFTYEGRQVRNYTLFYDTKELISYWVAYPLVPFYTSGVKRTDAWGYDPSFKTSEQPNLSSGYKTSGYDRGHQVPSADRVTNYEANKQTFYYTNMTPQVSGLNQQVWAQLEEQVRGQMSKGDTLYVVTGAVLKTVGGNERVNYANDRDGNTIAIPNYYFKVLLQQRSDGYKSIGMWYENRSGYGSTPSSNQAMSVNDIESKTGFDFFVNLPADIQESVEGQFSPQEWGFK